MKKLPLGIQSFEDLRSKDFLYVDKTEAVYRLITGSGKAFFLSRPRRFGKSLLVSTIENLFKGRKSLFESLYIYDKWDWTQQNPVIRLDFGSRSSENSESLRLSLHSFLDDIAERYSIILNGSELPDKFFELIQKIHERTGRQVVVLVDEYDKPIIDHLTDMDTAKANRAVLKNFYQVLKAADEHLCFVFLAGVSKFAKVSIFSELNNLTDITMEDEFSSICGYAQPELETCFDEYLEKLAEESQIPKSTILEYIRKWYDGYSWDGKTFVYNPFSTLSFFRKKTFSNYWFESGTPTFLIDLIKDRNDIQPILEPVQVDSTSFIGYDIQQIGIVTLLFQTGYLTVKSKINIPFQPSKYILGMPNEEVKDSFFTFLFSSYANYPVEQTSAVKEQMQKQIQIGDTTGFSQNLKILLANIPYQLHIPEEAYYHSLLLTWMKVLGFDIQGEVQTNIGRIDAVWRQPELTVIAEIKYHAEKSLDSLLDEAMKQIHDKKYYEKYLDGKIMLMAVAFSGREIGCRMEALYGV